MKDTAMSSDPVGVAVDSLKSAPSSRLVWVSLLAVAAAMIANVAFYYLLTGPFNLPLLVPEQFAPPETIPLGVADVVIFSLIFSAGACLVFAILSYTARYPVRLFLIISAVVLLLSFYLPMRIPSPPVALSTKLSLVAMHIIGATVVVGVLVRWGGASARPQESD